MKIDFMVGLKALNGEPIKDTKKEDVRLKDVCVSSLNNSGEDWTKIKPDEKYRRGQLAEVIFKSTGVIDVSAEDVSLLKAQVGKVFGPHIVRIVWDLLDPRN